MTPVGATQAPSGPDWQRFATQTALNDEHARSIPPKAWVKVDSLASALSQVEK